MKIRDRAILVSALAALSTGFSAHAVDAVVHGKSYDNAITVTVVDKTGQMIVIDKNGTVAARINVNAPGSPGTPKPPETPKPPVNPDPPSANCPAPDMRFVERSLFSGEKKFGLGSKAIAYKFDANRWRSGKTKLIQLVPSFAPGTRTQSQVNIIAISQCPGVLDNKKVGQNCSAGGNEISVRVRVDATSRGRCTLKGSGTYYLNVAAAYQGTFKPSCPSGTCGVLLKSPAAE